MPATSAAALTTVARCAPAGPWIGRAECAEPVEPGRAPRRVASRLERVRPPPPRRVEHRDRQVQERERRPAGGEQSLRAASVVVRPAVHRQRRNDDAREELDGGTDAEGHAGGAVAMPFEGEQTDDQRGDREQVPVLERVEQDGGGDRPSPRAGTEATGQEHGRRQEHGGGGDRGHQEHAERAGPHQRRAVQQEPGQHGVLDDAVDVRERAGPDPRWRKTRGRSLMEACPPWRNATSCRANARTSVTRARDHHRPRAGRDPVLRCAAPGERDPRHLNRR